MGHTNRMKEGETGERRSPIMSGMDERNCPNQSPEPLKPSIANLQSANSLALLSQILVTLHSYLPICVPSIPTGIGTCRCKMFLDGSPQDDDDDDDDDEGMITYNLDGQHLVNGTQISSSKRNITDSKRIGNKLTNHKKILLEDLLQFFACSPSRVQRSSDEVS